MTTKIAIAGLGGVGGYYGGLLAAHCDANQDIEVYLFIFSFIFFYFIIELGLIRNKNDVKNDEDIKNDSK